MEELTPLEEAALNAHDFVAGLAISGMIQQMIDRSGELDLIVKDRSLEKSIRADALAEKRNINLQLNIVASANALSGIGA